MIPRKVALATARACALAVAGVALGRSPSAQELPPAEQERGAPLDTDPGRALEVALSEESFGLAYRTRFHRGSGYAVIGALTNDEDDYAIYGRILRFAEPVAETPLGLGIGLGVFGAALEESEDEVFAVTLTGSIDWALPTDYPVRLGIEASYAPGIATFDEGEQVVELLARAEADLSSWATAFGGWRHLEVELEDAPDHDLDDAFQIGVRLGF